MPIGSDRRMRCAVITAIIGLGVLAPCTPAAATSQVLYVAPDGSGTDCTQAAPCELVSAISNAPSGADVILAPGSYGSPDKPIMTAIANGVDGQTYRSITVEGTPGSAYPTIHVGANYGVILVNSFIRRVTIEHSGRVGGLELYNTTAYLVRVDSAGRDWACEVNNSNLIDAVCHSTSEAADAVLAEALGGATITSDVTNVTAIAEGGEGAGVESSAANGSTASIKMRNTLAVGKGEGKSAKALSNSTATITGSNNLSPGSATTTDPGAHAEINVTDSIRGEPVLVDVTNGDYHERASSPTVDAGTSAGGTVDFDGLPRLMGSATDVGAYELPVAAQIQAAHVTHRAKHSLSVSAVVNSQGLPAVANLVAKSGHTTITSHRATIAGGPPTTKVRLKVKHLKPNAQYTLQIVVTDAGGTTTETVAANT